MNWIILDRFILRCSRRTTCRIRPGPQTEFSGYFRILPWEYLSGSRRPERYIRTFSYRPTSSVLTSEIFCLGEFTLVPELGYQSCLRPISNISATMGTSIYHGHAADTMQPREACAKSGILCWWCGQDAP